MFPFRISTLIDIFPQHNSNHEQVNFSNHRYNRPKIQNHYAANRLEKENNNIDFTKTNKTFKKLYLLHLIFFRGEYSTEAS